MATPPQGASERRQAHPLTDKKRIQRFVQAGAARFDMTSASGSKTSYRVGWDGRFGFHRVQALVGAAWSPVGLLRDGSFTVNDEAAAWFVLGAVYPGSEAWELAMDLLDDLRFKRPPKNRSGLEDAFGIFGLRPMELAVTDIRVRRFAWLWALLASEVPFPMGFSLVHHGRCGRCQADLAGETDLSRGYCVPCAKALLEPGEGLERDNVERVPFLPDNYTIPPAPSELYSFPEPESPDPA